MNLSDGTFATISGFLGEIGIPVEVGEIQEATFLPGIRADAGVLRVDLAKLAWPGDLLHEAGHLALLTGEQRTQARGDLGDNGGAEMGAIAWSYAAAIHLRLDPAVVFHQAGYHGGGQSMIDNFAAGQYIGVPMLQWLGLALDPRRPVRDGEPYPRMLRWLRG